jgi:cytochrome oxidase Cu insertion factor (SCO1/SenC/PrrC family)
MESLFAVLKARPAHALVLAILLSCAACAPPPVDQARPLGPGLTGVSPKLVLYNQNAQPVEAKSMMGRPLIVAFINTACTGMCQLTTNKLRRVADELGADQKQKVQFVLVTYNPVFDGPKRLTRYAQDMHLDTARWILLTGTPVNIDWMLGRFGLPTVGSVEDPAQLMDELDYVFLVAPEGKILKKYKGGDFITTDVAQDARRVLNKGAS